MPTKASEEVELSAQGLVKEALLNCVQLPVCVSDFAEDLRIL